MLVLTRKTGERIQVGEDIEITVVAVRGDQVRLGIVAPQHISICRSEVLEQVQRENIAAAESASRAPTPTSPKPTAGRPQPIGRGATVSPAASLKSPRPSADIKNSGAASRQSASADRERRHTHR